MRDSLAVSAVFLIIIITDEDRKKNIILFGLEEGENVSLDNKVDEVFLEIGQKPVLVQVVRLGQLKCSFTD